MNLLGSLVEKVYFRYRMQRGMLAFIRKNYWRIRGISIGSGTLVRKLTVTEPKQVSIGKNCFFEEDVFFKFASPLQKPSPSIVIGSGNFIGRGCEFNITDAVRIGENCLIASGCKFIDHDHGLDAASNMNGQPEIESSISIEDDVWLGANVIVLKGVTISHGAVVAAGAVVNKSIPSFEIWGGVPARKISMRTHS